MSFKKPLLVTILFSCVLIVTFYSFVFTNSQKVFFANDGGDGIKEYYSSIYHIKYDSSYFFCNSMNYPFGDELKFFGIQSIPVNIIKFIYEKTGWLNENSVVTYINVSMVLSLLLSAIFIHLILSKLQLPAWLIILFATPIAFLSPQIERFTGHFPLAISWFIPIAIYLLMLFHERKTVWISILIGTFNIYVYEVHAYFFLMLATFSIVYFSYCFFSKTKSFLFNCVHLGLQVLIPFLLVIVLDTIATNVSDRTGHPSGHMEYLSKPESVFLPISRKYFEPTAKAIFNSINYMAWEGRAFIGYLSIVIILIIIYRLFFKKDKTIFVQPTINAAFNTTMVTALLLLLFAFGFPFILELQSLIQYSGPIKQLRALGRFSWPFYYVINIFSVYYIYHYFKPKAALVLSVSVFIILMVDLTYVNNFKRNELNNSWNNYTSIDSRNNILQLSNKIHTEEYSAILPLPLFSIGSENINVDVRCDIITDSYALSLRTGLPLISTMSSRLSFKQAYEMQKIYFEPYRENIFWKEVLAKSTKNILLIQDNCNDLSEGERSIIKYSTKLFQQKNISVYSFNPKDAWKITDSLYYKEVHAIDSASLYKIKVRNWSDGFYYDDFVMSDKNGYLTKGVSETSIKKFSIIDTIDIPSTVSGNYIMSFWFSDIYQDVLPRTYIVAKAYSQSGEESQIREKHLAQRIKVTDCKWALFEDTLNIPIGTKKIILYSENKEISNKTLVIDDLCIRKTGQNIWFENPKGIVKNNRLFLKP